MLVNSMDTYFSRHTMVIGIDDATRKRLWSEHLVAVHVPHAIDGNLPNGPDNISLDPDDHGNINGGKRRIRALLRVAEHGGYVYAQYHLSESDVRYAIGKVPPGSNIEVLHGTWGGRYGQGNRTAALLYVKMKGVVNNPPRLRGAPPHSTLCQWPSIGSTVADLLAAN